jgi:copper homeostasis protein
MNEAILEVIACSVADAIQAQKGGASRLEVVRDLDRGGLTPSIDLVRAIRGAVHLPLRVMLRESDGFGISGETEIERLCTAAAEFSNLGVDGLVLGFLRGDEIDLELTRRVLACARGLKATFHHAFEDTANRLRAVTELKRLSQVDRILSHGGPGEWEQRMRQLASYAEAAVPELRIIAGGGIDGRVVKLLRRTTRIREFHVGRAARKDSQVDGPVVEELVRELVEATRAVV